jgi:hypothetical protein
MTIFDLIEESSLTLFAIYVLNKYNYKFKHVTDVKISKHNYYFFIEIDYDNDYVWFCFSELNGLKEDFESFLKLRQFL